MSVLRRANGVPFIEPNDKCYCDTAKLDAICASVYTQKTPWMMDKDDNKLFYVDSFGWRDRVPGECEICYKRFDDARILASKSSSSYD